MADFTSPHFSEDEENSMPEFIYRHIRFLIKLKIIFECAIIARGLSVFLYLFWNPPTLIFPNL